jgi:hypothetical protein
MNWLLIEACVAFAILVLIVWWTWPRKDRNDAEDDRD